MPHSTDMLNRLQPFQRQSKVFKEIFNAEGVQFEDRDGIISDLLLQLSVDTATWALDIYEKELDISTDSNKPLSERRSLIKSKMRGAGQVDAALIKIVADAYSNGDVIVSFSGHITIQFTSKIGTPPNLDDLKNVIEETKPAHLRIDYEFRYFTITEVNQMTIEELNNTTLDKFAH
jgi:hypothetical protein